MSTKISAPALCATSTLATRSQSSAILQAWLKVALRKKVALTLLNDLASLHFPHPLTISLHVYERWKPCSDDKLMGVQASLSTDPVVLCYAEQCLEATATKKPKTVRSSRSRTKTTRKGSRT